MSTDLSLKILNAKYGKKKKKIIIMKKEGSNEG